MAVMHYFKIHAGDFGDGEGSFGSISDTFSLPIKGRTFAHETLAKAEIAQIDIATEENVKKLSGTVGWGLVGGALLGPVGLLAGLLMGGRAKNVVFIVKLKDGRKLLASTDSKTFIAIQAAAF
jgi:hypothetical protein